MVTGIARTQKRGWTDMLDKPAADDAEKQAKRARFAAMLDSAPSESSSEKKPVPDASCGQGNSEAAESAALLRLAGGDKEKAEILRKAIEAQTAERFASAMALDYATNMVLAKRAGQLEKLTPEYVAMRQGIKCTDELLESILAQVADGISVYRICKRDDMPTTAAVLKHLNSADWLQKYQAAMLARTDKHVDEIAEASRELTAAVAAGASSDVVNAIKVHINTLQWIAARINPAKYGDRQTVDMNATVKLTEQQVDSRLQQLFSKAGLDAAALNAAPDPDSKGQ
jgi:hypothetical protein